MIMDQLAMENVVRCSGHVLRVEGGFVMRMALEFDVEGEMEKIGQKNMM